LFLLNYFHLIYKNIGQSYPINLKGKKKIEKYFLATLNEKVNLKLLPTGYHTAHPPKQNHCDKCNKTFLPIDQEIIVLICGHSYHESCYSNLHFNCSHCTEYYKKKYLIMLIVLILFKDKNITIKNEIDKENKKM